MKETRNHHHFGTPGVSCDPEKLFHQMCGTLYIMQSNLAWSNFIELVNMQT